MFSHLCFWQLATAYQLIWLLSALFFFFTTVDTTNGFQVFYSQEDSYA